jgi:thioredoxin-related protein
MSRIVALSLLLLLGYFPTRAQEKKTDKNELFWYTDANKAGEASNSSKKPIFAFFTGSDWCGWCHKLEREVFEKAEFKAWAAKNVILLELDFPRKKQLPAELMQQNNALQQAFKVQGYPTIWLFYLTKDEANNKQNINALGSLGYPEGAVQGKEEVKFLADANKILESDPNKAKVKVKDNKVKVKTKAKAKS